MITLFPSVLKTFASCPRQAHHRYVLKDLPYDPGGPAAQFGNDADAALEARLLKGTPLQSPFDAYEGYCAAILAAAKGKRLLVQTKLAVDQDHKPCKWSHPTAKLKAKLDVAVLGEKSGWLGDWKTGRPWEDPLQLQIEARLLFLIYPELEELKANYIWLKENRLGKVHVWNKANFYEEVALPVTEAVMGFHGATASNHWPAKPSGLCPYCKVKDCKERRP